MLGDQQYVIEWDPDSDLVVAVGAVAGPAGTVTLSLRGVDVEIDAADPRIVSSVIVDDAAELPRDARRHALLQRLVGEATSRDLLGAVGSPDRRRVEPPRDRAVPLRGVRGQVARLALLSSARRSPGLTGAERALAELEAVTLVRELKLGNDVPSDLMDCDAAAAALVEIGGHLAGEIGPGARPAVADVLEHAPLVDGKLHRGLADLARSLRQPSPAPRRDVAAGGYAPMPAAAMAAAEFLRIVPEPPRVGAEVTEDSLSRLLWDVVPTIIRTTGDEYEVRLSGCGSRTDGWWVRAFRPGTSVPLALAPMTNARGDAVAAVLLFHDDASEVEVDLVDDPHTPRASAGLAAFRAAINYGQRAARLDRLQRRDESASEWWKCAEAHRRAGDDSRSRRAEAIADQHEALSSRPRPTARVAPVITDLLGPRR